MDISKAGVSKAFQCQMDDGTKYLMVCDPHNPGAGMVLKNQGEETWVQIPKEEELRIMLIFLSYEIGQRS